jgi:uncharacterized protein (DUF4415 family)
MTASMSRRPTDHRAAAEAAFKPAKPKPVVAAPEPKRRGVPGAREIVTLRIDQDVVELFQSDGPGWQDRINQTLREAMRARLAAAGDGGSIKVDELNSSNDDGAG